MLRPPSPAPGTGPRMMRRTCATLVACELWLNIAGTLGAVRFKDLAPQCPVDIPDKRVSQLSAYAAAASTPEAVSTPLLPARDAHTDRISVNGFCDKTMIPSKDFSMANSTEWTAFAARDHGVRLFVANGGCTLKAVSVRPVTSELASIRFLFDSCASGAGAAVEFKLKQGGSQSNLVDWMCNVPGMKCGGQYVTTIAPGSTAAPSRIHLAREVLETPLGRGVCNSTGLHWSVPANTLRGCRLECAQRVELAIPNQNVKIAKNCSGYAWNGAQCELWGGPPITSAEVNPQAVSPPLPDKPNQPWACYSVTLAGDSYNNDKPDPATTVAPPAAKPVSLDMQTMLMSALPKQAVRKMVRGNDPNCFDGVDWYSMESPLALPSDAWSNLQDIFQRYPGRQSPPAAPAKQLVDRVCVVACDGTVAEECDPQPAPAPVAGGADCGSWVPWFLFLVASNILTALLVWWFCRSEPEKKRIRPTSVKYTDGHEEHIMLGPLE